MPSITILSHLGLVCSLHAAKARFIDQLAIEGAEESVCLMMVEVNIVAILEYSEAGGMVGRFGGLGRKEGANAELRRGRGVHVALSMINFESQVGGRARGGSYSHYSNNSRKGCASSLG